MSGDFERCWPWLEASLAEGSKLRRPDGSVWLPYEKHHLWQRILHGRATFWPGEACAVVTQLRETSTGIKTQFNWLAGGDLDEIVAMIARIEEISRANGCHRMQGHGRRGWLRAFTGYHETGTLKEKIL